MLHVMPMPLRRRRTAYSRDHDASARVVILSALIIIALSAFSLALIGHLAF